MSFTATVSLTLESTEFEAVQKGLSALAASYRIDSIHIHQEPLPDEPREGPLPDEAASDTQQEAVVRPKAGRQRRAVSSPTAGAEASSPAASATPAPAPEPASEKTIPASQSADEMVKALRTILGPISASGPDGKKRVIDFVTSRGFKSIMEIPGARLPELIEAAKALA